MGTKLTTKLFVLSSTFLFIFSFSTFAQSKAKKIEDLMQLYYDYGQFNGSILVAEKGSVIYKEGFGEANMEWNISNESDTKHRLGSITKQFTAMLILQLAEQGKIDIQKPIATYLPEYPKTTANKITTHHLLTHTSGIPNYTAFPDFFRDKSREPKTPDEFIEIFQDLPLDFEPGEKFNYSNSAYFLIGVIIEKITGKPYEENLNELIFDPLEMNDSGYDHHKTILKKRATGYGRNNNEFVNSNYIDMSLPYAAGSLYSTTEDLFKWDQALYDNKLITKESTKLLFSPYIKAWGNDYYAYGWAVGKKQIGTSKDSTNIVSHGGGINGFNTIIVRDVEQKNLVVLLNNTGGTSLGDMSADIMAIIYDKPFDLPKKSLVSELNELISKSHNNVDVNQMEKLANSNNYEIDEGDLNRLGYQFLGNEKVETAIEIFKLYVILYPDSSNAYDSLGEAYMENGDTKDAIVNYSKSVDMNPNNTNGIDMLEKMGADVSKYTKDVVTVSKAILKAYDGKYELMPNFIIEITHSGTQLFLQATGQSKSEIFASSETKFYSKIVNAQVTFNKDNSGKVVSLTLHQGGDHEAKKIE